MAKQKSRPEKRYVPQQESYRNLPGLRPTADTIVAAETPAPDGTGEKLRSLAEGLAAGNNALKDFFTMEKSFEETNRVANRVNATMGLPPTHGQGHLDYGVDYGYQEGLGMAAGATLKVQLDQALASQQYFINDKTLSSSEMTQKINEFTHKFIQENLGQETQNEAFLQGAGRELAEAKVGALVKGQKVLEERKIVKRIENWDAFVNAKVLPDVSAYLGKPQDFREYLTKIVSYAPGFELEKVAASDQMMSSMASQFSLQFDQAHDTKDVLGMQQAMQSLQLIKETAGLKDSSGVFLGGIVDKKSPINDTIKDLRVLHADSVKAYEKLKESTLKENRLAIKANMYHSLRNNLVSPEESESLVEKLRVSDPAGYIEEMDFLLSLQDKGRDIRVDPEVMAELRFDTSLTRPKIHTLLNSRVINSDAAKELASIVTDREQETQRQLSNYDRSLSIRDKEKRLEAADTIDKNVTAARTLLRERGVYEPGVVSRVIADAKDSNAPLSPETLDTWINGTQKAKEREEKVKEDARKLKETPKIDKVAVSGYKSKFPQGAPWLDSHNIELTRRVSAREDLPSDMAISNFVMWYSSAREAIKATGGSTVKIALEEQKLYQQYLIRHPLSTPQVEQEATAEYLRLNKGE